MNFGIAGAGTIIKDIMMCQCKFINSNKCTTLGGHANNWGGYT